MPKRRWDDCSKIPVVHEGPSCSLVNKWSRASNLPIVYCHDGSLSSKIIWKTNSKLFDSMSDLKYKNFFRLGKESNYNSITLSRKFCFSFYGHTFSHNCENWNVIEIILWKQYFSFSLHKVCDIRSCVLKVEKHRENNSLLHFYGDCTIAWLTIQVVHLVYCEVDMPNGTLSL